MIHFNEEQQYFHLFNKNISYLMEIEDGGYLSHLYFGKKINTYSGNYSYPRTDRSFSPNFADTTRREFSLDTVMLEYPGYGFGDFREPAYVIEDNNGSRINSFKFKNYEIIKGKPNLKGLPSSYVNLDEEAETLIIELVDDVTELSLFLKFTIFAEHNIITKSVEIVNNGISSQSILKLASQTLDLHNQELELIHLNGAWARERSIIREKIQYGVKKIDSKRGASSHFNNPFIAIVQPKTDEFQGEAYGFNLVYSGNHQTIIQKDSYNQTRIISGINDFNFKWVLESSKSFQTPEAILSFSDEGLNDLSNTFHNFSNNNIVRGKFKNKERPVLINNWEATYFNFNEEKIFDIVDNAKSLGIELFVLDDGWFGKREDDNSSLGDWYENKGKLSSGLKKVAETIKDKGLDFGLWFEPEMISRESNLFEKHPDWALQTPNRDLSLSRNQYVLDFTREDVRNYVFDRMSELLTEIPIDYVKWDMNRNLSEVYSFSLDSDKQGEVFHRYVLGLYDFLEKLIGKFPDVLFESCSGGGGRFDLGLLSYMPQAWTSDNTDAISRLKIQYGSSLAYPISSMGAHVSAVPNHQTGRNTSLFTRGNVSMTGAFGYELDLTTLTLSEKNEIKEQIIFFKQNRKLLQYGTFVRLISPFEGNETAWMVVSEDKNRAIVFYFRTLNEASHPFVTLKLSHLDSTKKYKVDNQFFYGDELANMGLYINPKLHGDYVSQRFYLESI